MSYQCNLMMAVYGRQEARSTGRSTRPLAYSNANFRDYCVGPDHRYHHWIVVSGTGDNNRDHRTAAYTAFVHTGLLAAGQRRHTGRDCASPFDLAAEGTCAGT